MISPATLVVHAALPARSSATTSPLSVPATILPSPTSTPPESGFFVSSFAATRPVASSMTVIEPSAAAA